MVEPLADLVNPLLKGQKSLNLIYKDIEAELKQIKSLHRACLKTGQA